MMPRIQLTVFFALILFAGSASPASEQNSGYFHWSAYKPGTMVSFRCLTAGSGADQTIIKTFTLTSVSPDAAIVENKEIPASGGATSPSLRPPLGIRLEFRASAFPKDNEDNFQTYLVTNIESLLRDPDKIVEGSEALTVKGRRIQTARMRILEESPAVRTEFTVWTSPEIPGRLVRLVREIRAGGATIRDEISAVDFLALPASPSEVAALRSARKPEWVEVTGLQFVQNETRWFEDWEDWIKEEAGFKNALNLIVPGSSNSSDWNALNKQYIRRIESTRNLKAHLEEDRAKAEAKLPDADRDKFRPFFGSCGRYADLYLKFLDVFSATMALVDDPAKAGNLAPFVEELRSQKLESETVYARLQDECKKLAGIRLKYLR